MPNTLREYAHIDKDVVVIGVSNRIEIWNKEAWDTYNKDIAPTVAQIAESLIDLGI